MKKFILNPKFLNPLILTLLGIGFLRLSWDKWVNITEDYGRELYIPWRITCGQVLYKDMASLFGPFPPYWNALLFKIFGVSIMTLVLFNIALVAMMTILIYRFFNYVADHRTALFTSAAFLCILAFRQGIFYWDQGNYSYICPYTYSVTYALFLSWWALNIFTAYTQSSRKFLLGILGVLIGLTALCRFEIFMFLGIAIALGLSIKGTVDRWSKRQFFTTGVIVLGSFLVPVGIAYGYFSSQLEHSAVISYILGINEKWWDILNSSYYQYMTGLDHPWQNFKIMLASAACYGLVMIAVKVLCMGADFIEMKEMRWLKHIFLFLGIVSLAVGCFRIILLHEDFIFKGLPLLLVWMVGYQSWLLWRYRHDEVKVRLLLPLWVMAVWALLMLTKVLLRVQITNEGFVYAMPGVMLLIVCVQGLLPRYFERAHPKVNFTAALASVLVVLILIVEMRSTLLFYHYRSFPIRTKAGTIICNRISDNEIGEIAAFLKNVDKIMGRGANFVAFPDGIMLNFLTHRITPLPYLIFKISETIGYGQTDVIRSFQRQEPDYVIMSNRDWRPDFPNSASRYPYKIRAWIVANYHPVWPSHPEAGNVITVLKRTE